MRILIVSDYWKPILDGLNMGGTERCVVVISTALKELGNDVFISAPSESSDSYNTLQGCIPILKWVEPSKQYKVENYLGRLNTRSNIIPSIISQIVENNIEYVMLNNTNQNIIRTISDYCKDNNIKVSVHIHSDIYNWGMGGQVIIDQLENITSNGINTVAVSEYHKRKLGRGSDRPTINSVLKHFYIDVPVITELKNNKLVVSASRLDKSKQNHLLLKNLPDDFNATLMGNISKLNDKDIDYYENTLKTLLNKSNVNYIGSVTSDEVYRQMRLAKHVYDGDNDSPGSVQIVEAIANGCFFIRPKLYDDGAAEFINSIGLGYRIITIDQMVNEYIPDLSLEQMNKDNELVRKSFGKDSFMDMLTNLIGSEE